MSPKATGTTLGAVTCLGCGCACDDIEVTVRDGRIAGLQRACPLGERWFGDGAVPTRVIAGGGQVAINQAIEAIAALLAGARGRTLVYLAPGLSCEAQRAAVAVADHAGGLLDNIASDSVGPAILAAQRRGRATATLGELRNRADVVVFWGVDPMERYPRFAERYAVQPAGLQTPKARKSRTIVAVDVGASRGPADADLRLTLAPEEEIAALTAIRVAVQGREIGTESAAVRQAVQLARRLLEARYVALVHDGEPGGLGADPVRAEALITLAQTLNGPVRAAMMSLRAGGNRNGAEAVMTWQTGFPFAVDFSRGAPRYQPESGAGAALAAGRITAVLVCGAAADLPAGLASALEKVPTAVIGPRASECGFSPRVAIDTGIAGIHEEGMALRMDDVPIPLRAPLQGARPAAEVLQALAGLLARKAAR